MTKSDLINNHYLAEFIYRFQLQLPQPTAPVFHSRQAAVLIPIVCHRTSPTLLLTRRALHLRKHGGQIAFPGGAADLSDKTLAETALREAHEEIGLFAHQIHILGQLPPLDSISGFQVTPIVGLVTPTIQLCANPMEVDDIFEMPLNMAFDLQRYTRLQVKRAGQTRSIYLSCFNDHLIWGLTAKIIHRLARQVTL